MAMARSKLDEHKLREVALIDLEDGEDVELGPFSLELIHMTHSIPDASAVALTSELGTILVTGDYKFDQTPVDGEAADMARLAQLGAEGILLLCGDSTNADRPGFSPSESVVGPHLEEVFARAPGRVIVTSFASNIHRVQQVIDAAAALGRKVALVGRSMRKNVAIGSQLGHIEVPDGLIITPREIDDFPDHRMVVISTGSQGEPLSALRRMAYRDHPQVKLHDGDTVVFSATPIPGNERAVNDTIDRLYHIGCEVITTRDAPIHASGHGYTEELKLMLNLTKPRYVMPFHGDFKRIQLHRRAGGGGRDRQRGDLLCRERRRARARRTRRPLRQARARGDDLRRRRRHRRRRGRGAARPPDALRRRHLHRRRDDLRAGRRLGRRPEVIFRGVAFLDEAGQLVDEIKDTVEDSLERAATEGVRDVGHLQQLLHDHLGALIYERLKRRPMVLPVVVEV